MFQFVLSNYLWLWTKVCFDGQLWFFTFFCTSLLSEAEKERDELGVLHIANLVKLVQLKIKFVVSEVWVILPSYEVIKESIQDVCLK